MRKILTLILIMALLVATTGCGSEKTAKAYDIYTEASNAMSNIDSLIADTTMTMVMPYEGENVEVKMNGLVKEVIINETDIELELDMQTSVMGQDMSVRAFYKDGVYYMEMDGQKMSMEMPMDEVMEQANTEALSFPETAVKNQEAIKNQDGSHDLTFTLDGTALTDSIASQMGSLNEMMGSDVEMGIGDIDYVVVVDADGNLKSTAMSFSMDMDMMGESASVTIDMLMDFVQIGNVTIDFPTDLDTYMAIEM